MCGGCRNVLEYPRPVLARECH
ncbi:MAG: hypothetical protein ACI4J8_06100 [Oscillospiraceae bacterium]